VQLKLSAQVIYLIMFVWLLWLLRMNAASLTLITKGKMTGKPAMGRLNTLNDLAEK